MTSEPFRLMDLPELVREKVVEYMEGPDLIVFSMCSKKMYELAHRVSYQLVTLVVEVNVAGFFSDFLFIEDHSTEEPNIVGFQLAALKNPAQLPVLFSIFAGDESLGVQRNVDSPGVQNYYCDAIVPAMIALTDYTIKLLDKTGRFDKRMILDVPRLNDLVQLLEWETVHKLTILRVDYELMSSSELDLLLQNFEIAAECYFTCNTRAVYQLKKFKARTFALNCSPPWRITSDFIDCLLDNTVNIHLSSITITNELMNTFIRKWVEREQAPPLHFLHFVTPRNMPFNRAAVERGHTLHPFDPEKRGPTFIMKNLRQQRAPIPCHDCPDVYRADGLIGTFRVEEGCFQFVVWHEPFPV